MKNLFLIFFLSISFAAQAQSFKIGIIADCQYCDCEFNKEWNNDYRKGLPRLKMAVDIFNDAQVDLVFHLGDFIDRDFESYKTVKPIISKLAMPTYFVLGNHEFSVADSLKETVLPMLNLTQAYYAVRKNNWLFIVLDGTDVSPYRSSNSQKIKFAKEQMKMYEQMGRSQAKPWNGAIGEAQLVWLENQLENADKKELNVVVMAHFPVLPKAALNLWNDVEVVQILDKHNGVKAYFNGHHHPGNYALNNGIHYVTFQGMVRSENETAFAIVEISDTTLKIIGTGREPSRSLRVR